MLTWWPAFAGPHNCELCAAHLDSGEIIVPAGELLFVAPTMVAHYVAQHEYLPPLAFVRAVMACPEPGTSAYAEAVVFAARADDSGIARVRFGRDRSEAK